MGATPVPVPVGQRPGIVDPTGGYVRRLRRLDVAEGIVHHIRSVLRRPRRSTAWEPNGWGGHQSVDEGSAAAVAVLEDAEAAREEQDVGVAIAVDVGVTMPRAFPARAA